MDAGTLIGIGGGIVGVLTTIVVVIVSIIVTALSALIPIAAIVLTIVLLKRVGDSRAAEKKLLQTGTRAVAVVLELSETGFVQNKEMMVDVKLRVQPPDQPPFEATTQLMTTMLLLPRLQPGSRLAVAFDPANHSRLAIDLSTDVETTAYCRYCSATFPAGPTECPRCGAALVSPS